MKKDRAKNPPRQRRVKEQPEINFEDWVEDFVSQPQPDHKESPEKLDEERMLYEYRRLLAFLDHELGRVTMSRFDEDGLRYLLNEALQRAYSSGRFAESACRTQDAMNSSVTLFKGVLAGMVSGARASREAQVLVEGMEDRGTDVDEE